MAKKKATSKKTSTKVTKKVEAKEVKPVKKVEAVKVVASKSNNKIIETALKPSSLAALTAEFIGTFLLAGVVLATQGAPVSLLFGLVAIVLILGNVSGAHVNPLLTVGAWATRRISSFRALGYIIAQILGAMLAFVIFNAFVSAAPQISAEAQYYGQTQAAMFTASPIVEGKEWLILLAELLGATIFGFAVAHITADKKHNSTAVALGVGTGLFLAAILSGYLANVIGGGVVLNPAIAISLQAFTVKGTSTVWAIATYAGASLIGGILGFGLSSLIAKNSDK